MDRSVTGPTVLRSQDVVLSVKDVSKKFCRNLKLSMFYALSDIIGEIFGVRKTSRQLRKQEFWALQDISFELKRGDAIGLVGANGAGKTTLLKIISGLIKPDNGNVHIKGCVAPLIALGAGFNPMLSGRENVYVNMAILGLTKEQIDERFDEVVGFAEIGHAIDAPVQTYSSGMNARLGFACAVHTDPDILLIDEVLAVGDVKFRMKCYRKLAALKGNGTSFILVSHSSHSIISVCNLAAYLSGGRLVSKGNTIDVFNKYEEDLFSRPFDFTSQTAKFLEKKREDSYGVDILEIYFKNSTGDAIESAITSEETFLCIKCRSWIKTKVGVNAIVREVSEENRCTVIFNSYEDKRNIELVDGIYEIKVHLPFLGLRPSNYTLKISISKDSVDFFDAIEDYRFVVRSSNKNFNNSLYYQPHDWQVEHLSENI